VLSFQPPLTLAPSCIGSNRLPAVEGTLTTHPALDQLDEEVKRRFKAITYHQLGRVAQQQHQWVQAEQYF
jgi:uncharacterized protein